MYFNKYHQPENFVFPAKQRRGTQTWTIQNETFHYRWRHLGEDVYRLDIKARRWGRQLSQAELNTRFDGKACSTCELHPTDGLRLRDIEGSELLASEPGRVFGVSGCAWLMQFAYDPAMRFYGMGEKTLGMELSGRQTKFWNTDVWADFDMGRILNGSPDPLYLSVPYLVIQRGGQYAGVLVNNPYAVFMSTHPHVRIADQADAHGHINRTRFYLGAPDGVPELYFIVGPTLRELTCKLQRLVGTTPLPPIWALGHHQCRWGYAGFSDLDKIEKTYRKHAIPNDGLWLDIDYMNGYRVFTWDDQHWPNPAEQIEQLQSRGQRVVPILDPGVKLDEGYDVYRCGKREDIFCKNPAGTDFIGFVWPGTTVFPDFSMQEGRQWWSKWTIDRIAQLGISGVWIDMNDPSTGPSFNGNMLFNWGMMPHEACHNQYALGMAKSTHDAFRQHRPDHRPFLISRSGFTTINRYSAVWTGDNYSNAHHMRLSIPTSLNLALSGVPFNGPDVGGFGGDATRELLIAWYKAGFLFPFLRNHSAHSTRDQEPWAFGAKAMRTIRHYIRLRYKLLPYLYQLFIEQEQNGEAILRPLFHDFDGTRSLPLDKVDDQFMVGPAIMQAPMLEPKGDSRQVILPKGQWFDAMRGRWIAGGRRIKVRTDEPATPLYIRDGAVIPMRPGQPKDNRTDLRDVELHLFISPAYRGTASCTYRADDGESYGYQRGERSIIRFDIRRGPGGRLMVDVNSIDNGFGPVRVRLVTCNRSDKLILRRDGEDRPLPTRSSRWRFTGALITSYRTQALRIGLD